MPILTVQTLNINEYALIFSVEIVLAVKVLSYQFLTIFFYLQFGWIDSTGTIISLTLSTTISCCYVWSCAQLSVILFSSVLDLTYRVGLFLLILALLLLHWHPCHVVYSKAPFWVQYYFRFTCSHLVLPLRSTILPITALLMRFRFIYHFYLAQVLTPLMYYLSV